MDKLKMHTPNLADENFKKLSAMFPNAVTETINENGEIVRAIDADVLRQEISASVVEGKQERYQFTWPDKKKSVVLANQPINKTLRLDREKSVGRDGTPGSIDTENIYIEGDNLEALKLLQETYLGKVKMIYIDPPYNTGNDFIYGDDFSQSTEEYLGNSGQSDEIGNRLVANPESNGRFHTDWLNMIYPRLKIAKDLLSDEGVIFISIDDNELDNLRKVCDDIFGESNFIAHIIHKNNSMKNQSKYIGVSTEYVLIYAKSLSTLNSSSKTWRASKKGVADVNNMFLKLKNKGMSLEEISEEIKAMYSRPKYSHLSRWNKVDECGVFTDKDLSRANGPKNYTITNPFTGKDCVIPNRGWGKSKEDLLELQKKNMIWYGDGSTPPREKSYITDGDESVFDNFIFVDTSVEKRNLELMFGRNVFDYPKSVDMIKTFIQLSTEKDDIVLDFFSGSATTAHALLQQNIDDAGRRKFIMVQLPEKCSEDSEAFRGGFRTICEIGEERIRRAGNKIKDEHQNSVLDIGFRVFKVDSSNMKDVYYKPADYDQGQIDLFAENIKEDRIPEDLLFQVMLDLGVLPSSKIEEKTIDGKKVFSVADGYLIACFDKEVTEDIVKAIAQKQPYYAVFQNGGIASDSVATNFEQIFETYSPQTQRRIL